MTKNVECPECDKIIAVKEKSVVLGDFLDWLMNKGIRLGQWKPTPAEVVLHRMSGRKNGQLDEVFTEIIVSNEVILAEYFGIDLKKVEEERQALLEYIRKEKKCLKKV